jgi:hypothetical protein
MTVFGEEFDTVGALLISNKPVIARFMRASRFFARKMGHPDRARRRDRAMTILWEKVARRQRT